MNTEWRCRCETSNPLNRNPVLLNSNKREGRAEIEFSPKPQMESVMSKNSYGDMLAVLQYIDSKKEKVSRFRSKKGKPETDLFNLLQQKKQEAKLLEEWLKDQEKINKKEDKKTGFEALSVFQRWALLTFIGPPLGLCYFLFMNAMFKAALVYMSTSMALNAARFG